MGIGGADLLQHYDAVGLSTVSSAGKPVAVVGANQAACALKLRAHFCTQGTFGYHGNSGLVFTGKYSSQEKFGPKFGKVKGAPGPVMRLQHAHVSGRLAIGTTCTSASHTSIPALTFLILM